MENWDEVKTAYQVARMGTVSGAADVLGVHHATVIRHVDALEQRLGVKLFQRHARGYTATEAGMDLLRVAQTTEDQFNQLLSRIKGQGLGVSGDLVVTSLDVLAPRIAPLLVAFQQEYPDVVVRFLTGDRLFRLEYGEAHVAIRAGAAPDQPDNVVQPLVEQSVGLYASAGYIARHGMPQGPQDYAAHRFVGHEDADNRAPFYRWLAQAVRCGAGIGFLTKQEVAGDENLVCISEPQPEWASPLWLVTHVDLHRTSKVQALVQFLKAQIKDGYL